MSASQQLAVAADCVFDGAVVHRHHAVLIDGDRIAGLVPRREVPSSVAVRDLPDGAWLAPGFIDLQVNGGGDRLFNDDPSPEAIAAIAAAHRCYGTTALLPTLITDTLGRMRRALAAVESAMNEHPSVLGIHFEGPWLSPEKPGVHAPDLIRRPHPDEIAVVTGLRAGSVLVTVAPEQLPDGLVADLARSGVRVSLGHSMATYAQTRAAMAAGLTGFTHLFNAMRPLSAREPGPVAAALESSRVWYGMIVDGIHVAPPMLRLALRGAARPMLVTDAMPPVGGRRQGFRLYGEEITVRDGRCLRRDGALAGAALDMATAVANAVRLLDMPLTAALRAASTEPARFLGLGDRLGRLAPGCRADMVAIEPDTVRVLATWLAGQASD